MTYIQLLLNGAVQGLVISLAAVSISLVFRVARFPNIATGDLLTVGAFATLAAHEATGSLVVSAVAAASASALVALGGYVLVFRPLARRPVASLLVASIGLAFVIRAVMGLAFGHGQHVVAFQMAPPLRVGELRVPAVDLSILLVCAAAVAVIFGVLHLTSMGRQMRAVADNRDLARVSGVRSDRVMVSLWLFAGSAAGVGGLMLGIKTVVSPEIGWDLLMPALAAAILGGIGSPLGAVLAGMLLGMVQEVSTPFVGFTYKIVIAFAILLLVLLVRPSGLFGHGEAVR